MKKILCVITAVVMTAAVLSSCGTAAQTSGGSFTVTDMTGTEVSIPAQVERVVALTPGDCETVFALGAGDLVVGRGFYCDKPEEVADIEAVESGTEMNIEQLLALKPDVVFVSSVGESLDGIEELRKSGIAVVETQANDIEGVYEQITLTGQVLGREKEAEDLISSMKADFDEIAASVKDDAKGRTIYFEVSPLEYGLFAAGSGTFMNEIAEMLGLENIFAEEEGWPQVSEEQVIARDPDYILTISYDGESMTAVDEIKSRPAWQNVAAVKEDKVLQITDNSLSRPSPELVSGARQLADMING